VIIEGVASQLLFIVGWSWSWSLEPNIFIMGYVRNTQYDYT